MGWKEVERCFTEAIEEGAIPGATLRVRRGEDVVFEGAFGYRSIEPERTPMHIETVFDLSSLTKPLATTMAMMILTCDGKLRLDDRVTRFFHDFGVHGKAYVTFRQLLAHCSGLAAWRPFFQEIEDIERSGKVNFMASHGAKEFVYEEIHREKPEYLPGTRTLYSDLNFILLAEALEQVGGGALNRICREKIFRPLGLPFMGFVDLALKRPRRSEKELEIFAPTSVCQYRKRLLIGEVEDANAFAMGGVAGHAGLFAEVRDVDRIVLELLRCYAGKSDFIPQKIVREFWTRDKQVKGSTWALGWDSPSPEYSSSGHHFSNEAVGHLGFTGTSVWIEPSKQIAITLLTNRVHPQRDNQAIRDFRPKIHDLIMNALGIS